MAIIRSKSLCSAVGGMGFYTPAAAQVSRQRGLAGGQQHQQPFSSAGLNDSDTPPVSHAPRDDSNRAPAGREVPPSVGTKDWLNETVRGGQASEAILLGFYRGQRRVHKGNRPDLDFFEAKEEQLVSASNDMVLRHRVRPSLLKPLASAAGYAIGVGSALAGQPASFAAAGAMRDVAEEHYNDAVRHMIERPASSGDESLKNELKEMRDADRAPEGSPRAPGVEALRDVKDLTPLDAIGAAIRVSAELLLAGAKRL